jgi:hypothetical protein
MEPKNAFLAGTQREIPFALPSATVNFLCMGFAFMQNADICK